MAGGAIGIVWRDYHLGSLADTHLEKKQETVSTGKPSSAQEPRSANVRVKSTWALRVRREAARSTGGGEIF